ncbi:MAG: rubrerythrin [Lentisphaerae bacterium]|nr:rubrerythrin [Lentisphaerota bacterium]
MPEFSSPFSGLANDRKLTPSELIRAMRYMIAAEYEAVQLYMQLAESTDNTLARNVLMDVADEERVHAGEFLRVLHELAPDEAAKYEEGSREVEDEFLGGGPGGSTDAETGAGEAPPAGRDGSLGIGSLK